MSNDFTQVDFNLTSYPGFAAPELKDSMGLSFKVSILNHCHIFTSQITCKSSFLLCCLMFSSQLISNSIYTFIVFLECFYLLVWYFILLAHIWNMNTRAFIYIHNTPKFKTEKVGNCSHISKQRLSLICITVHLDAHETHPHYKHKEMNYTLPKFLSRLKGLEAWSHLPHPIDEARNEAN